MERKEVWVKNFEGIAKGGIMFRSFELNKFIENLEKTEGKVVGLIFDGNNVEILVEVEEDNVESEDNDEDEE